MRPPQTERDKELRKFALAALRANRRYPGNITSKEVAALVEKSGRRCHWCAKENLMGGDLTLEHLEPRNALACLVIACLSCNVLRKDRPEYNRTAKRVVDAAKMRQWRAANRMLAKCRRAAESANKRYPGKIAGEDLLAIAQRCGFLCHWCQKADLSGRDLTFEHLQPVNHPQHIVLACYSCNASKTHPLGRKKTEAEKYATELEGKRRNRIRTTEARRAYRRKYYEANAEAIRARASEYHQQKRAIIAVKKRDYDQQYYAANRQAKIDAAAEWKARNRDKVLARRRELWALKQKERKNG